MSSNSIENMTYTNNNNNNNNNSVKTAKSTFFENDNIDKVDKFNYNPDNIEQDINEKLNNINLQRNNSNSDKKLQKIDENNNHYDFNHIENLRNKLSIDINSLEDFESLESFQKIFLICPVQKLKLLLDVQNEVENLIRSSNNINLHLQNSKFYELLRLDIFNDVYENIYKIINKFYFKFIILNTDFKERLENILINYWTKRNNFDEDSLLNLDLTGTSTINQVDDFRKISVMSTSSLDENVIKRFRESPSPKKGSNISPSPKKGNGESPKKEK